LAALVRGLEADQRDVVVVAAQHCAGVHFRLCGFFFAVEQPFEHAIDDQFRSSLGDDFKALG
jgi:hypothetical protein